MVFLKDWLKGWVWLMITGFATILLGDCYIIMICGLVMNIVEEDD